MVADALPGGQLEAARCVHFLASGARMITSQASEAILLLPDDAGSLCGGQLSESWARGQSVTGIGRADVTSPLSF